MTPYETAKARVEAGDFSLDAIGALTIAHGEKLVADSQRLDHSALLTNEGAEAYVRAYYAKCDAVYSVDIQQAAFIRANDDMPCDSVVVIVRYTVDDGKAYPVRHTDEWTVWVEFGRLYGEC